MKTVIAAKYCLLLALTAGIAHADEASPFVLVSTECAQLGAPIEQLTNRPIPIGKDGYVLLALSPHEQAVFMRGKLIRYFCIEGEGRQCRARTTPPASVTFSFVNKQQGMGLRILDEEFFAGHPSYRVHPSYRMSPPSGYAITHVDGKPYSISFSLGNGEMLLNGDR